MIYYCRKVTPSKCRNEESLTVPDELSKTRRVVLGVFRPGCKYDRYLVDIYITDTKTRESRFLNQALLDEGLAIRVEG